MSCSHLALYQMLINRCFQGNAQPFPQSGIVISARMFIKIFFDSFGYCRRLKYAYFIDTNQFTLVCNMQRYKLYITRGSFSW